METTSSVSLLQLGGLMIGLVILAVIFMIAALLITRRRKAPAARGKTTPAQPANRPRSEARPTTTPRTPAQSNPRPPASGAVPVPMPDPTPPGAVEVMRVFRQADETLIIQINGKQYRTLGDVRQAGIEKPFLGILRELARIAKETGDQVTRPVAPSAPTPAPIQRAAPLPSLEELTGATKPAREPEPIGTFFGNMRRMIPGAPSEADLSQPVGIAEQIEAILQLKLLSSEEFRGQRLHVRAAPGGGVQIVVGDQIYEAVGDIQDEGIRTFVQSAIQDWERQQG